MRPTSDDPTTLSPHERLRELTAILATGIHRLRGMTPVLPECGQILGKSSQTGLGPGRGLALMTPCLPKSSLLDPARTARAQ